MNLFNMSFHLMGSLKTNFIYLTMIFFAFSWAYVACSFIWWILSKLLSENLLWKSLFYHALSSNVFSQNPFHISGNDALWFNWFNMSYYLMGSPKAAFTKFSMKFFVYSCPFIWWVLSKLISYIRHCYSLFLMSWCSMSIHLHSVHILNR